MKQFKWIAISIFCLFLFQSCSSPVYVQKDDTVNLSDYHTYMWVTTKRNETDDSKRATDYADISIHNTVNAELNQAGWREVESGPDILISYDVLVEKTVKQQSEPVYSQGFSRMYYNPYRRRWATIYYPSQFLGYDVYNEPVKEGTITITMMDSKTDKNVWQGWTTEQLDNARLTNDEIAQSVKNIFRKFDVAVR
jgi:hypothetical protein